MKGIKLKFIVPGDPNTNGLVEPEDPPSGSDVPLPNVKIPKKISMKRNFTKAYQLNSKRRKASTLKYQCAVFNN